MTLAASGDEMTTVVMLPSWSDITGPYFLDSLVRERCGFGPRSSTFPIIGYGLGPGGSFDDLRAEEYDLRMIHTMEKITSNGVGKFMINVSARFYLKILCLKVCIFIIVEYIDKLSLYKFGPIQ